MISYLAGASAEKQVAAHYLRNGMAIKSERWRGQGGEIDLVAQDGDGLVFIEVKKSRSHARAAERLSLRQSRRLFDAASEYMATFCTGGAVNARFDVALVDGTGRIEIIENALVA